MLKSILGIEWGEDQSREYEERCLDTMIILETCHIPQKFTYFLTKAAHPAIPKIHPVKSS